jgi:rod shape-determining protein MreD
MPIALQRDIGYPGRLVPFLTTVLFAFFSIVPLNLPGFAVVMPAFALMAIFHWSVYRPDLLPLSAVFVSGLLLDLMNGTPYVGISALIFLVGRSAVMSQRKLFVNRPFAIVWLGFLVLAVAVFVLLWALVSALHGGFIDLRPFAFQAVLTVACYPAASYVLARAQRAFLAQA